MERPLYTAGRSQAPYGPPPEDLSAGYPKRKDLRPPEDQSKLRIVDELCKKAGFEPDFVLEGNVELLSDYMREGLGVSFGLASVRDAYRDIRSIPLADEIGEASIYLSWCGERYLTNSMLTLQSYLRDVGKQIEAER